MVLKDGSLFHEGGFFAGYNIYTWLVILNNAFNGLVRKLKAHKNE
jgi:hypothetical protein